MKAVLSLFLMLQATQGFAPVSVTSSNNGRSLITTGSELYSMEQAGASSPIDDFIEDIKMRVRIAQESNAAGDGTKQTIANVLAGEYDVESVKAKIEEEIASAPCVMFTWDSSPSCKKAIQAFDTIGANAKIVRLDDPWSEGNPIRAELGKRCGRTAVPFVFIKGEYVGGFDGGIEGDEDVCGLVDLAFRGTLRQKLSEAGAMKA